MSLVPAASPIGYKDRVWILESRRRRFECRAASREARGIFPGASGPEHGGLREGPADQLETDGKAARREAAGYRDRRHASERGRCGVGATSEEAFRGFLLACDWRGVAGDGGCRMRRGGRQQEVVLPER